MKRALGRIEIPDEHEARERAWTLLQAAFAEREPVVRPRRRWRPLLAVAVGLSLVGAALSPAGGAVVRQVREAIGIERAAPALFSLPTQGRLLVDSDVGPWIVEPDGSKRRLGRYRETSWSPSGLYVVAARRNELTALDPDGDVRWRLARPSVRFPRWTGSRIDTRIAYLAGSELRVVAGDGTGDSFLAGDVHPVAPAWRAGRSHVLALSDRAGRIHVYATDKRALQGRSQPGEPPLQLEWFPGGGRLLVLAERTLRVLDFRGRLVRAERALGGSRHVAAALGPHGEVALLRRRGDRSEVVLGGRRVFSGAGAFTDVAWSPDGRWLLVGWRNADQLLFLRSAGVRRIEAVSDISAQFESSRFPSISGWCCP